MAGRHRGARLLPSRTRDAIHRPDLCRRRAGPRCPGHPHRDFDEWRVDLRHRHDRARAAGARVARRPAGRRRDGRIFADGTGWVAAARGREGRARHAASAGRCCSRRCGAGARPARPRSGWRAGRATAMPSASTSASGLTIDREWMEYRAGPTRWAPREASLGVGQCAASCQVRPTPTDTSSGTSS